MSTVYIIKKIINISAG